ncbi:MAG TPA: AroM family protein [Trueperaceae bacterium]
MKLAFATIGEAPRDDLVPFLREQIPPDIEVLEDGVLNHLSQEERLQLDVGDDSLHMVTRDRDGNSYRLNYQRTLPQMQRVVDGLVDKGADLVVILCGADWTPVKARVPIVNPGRLFPNLIQALGSNVKLGIIKPDSGQIPHTERQYRDELGLDSAVVAASPYVPERLDLARQAARELSTQGVELVWMTCVGMGEEMRSAVRSVLPVPTILARSILAKVINELLTDKARSRTGGVPA